MADKRLKGQEVSVQVVVGGQLSDAFTAVASFNDTAKFDKKEDGFLGETTNRYDETFNGFDGSLEMQVSSQKWMEFQALIKARAKREQPDLIINLVRVDFYANGDTPTRTYQDCSFGPMPSNVPDRGGFVTVSLDFSCGDVDDNLQALL